jgi:hypothetical protein
VTHSVMQLVMVTFVSLVCGCGAPETRSQELGTATLQPTPVIDVAQASIWPQTSGRRYAVFTRSATDPSRFVVYGIEVPRNPTYDVALLVEGSLASDLDSFHAWMEEGGAVSLMLIHGATHTAPEDRVLSIFSGQVGNPPPTDPPGIRALEIAEAVDAGRETSE